jgi:AGCS family alanine or glycine:cation symporter
MSVSPQIVGIAAGVLTGVVIVGGNHQIAKVCTRLVPLMSICYLGGCLWIMAVNYQVLPAAIQTIVCSAFSTKAVSGGCLGGGVLLAMRTGISRGLFTNEAGLGSIPMTAASADTKDPIQQALISMTGPFWDTVVMCAVTGIAIVSSMLANPQNYVGADPERMCFIAFSGLPFGGKEILSLSMVLFAFATIIGWNVYGMTAVHYLFGQKGGKVYQVFYMLAVYLGAVISMELVWGISDLFNSLMAIPNLLCLWRLRNEIKLPKN